MTLRDTRSLSPASQEDLRMRVVAAVLGGMKQTEAARVFQVARESISRWIRAYRRNGQKALKARKKGPLPGSRRLLTIGQERQVAKWVICRLPGQLQLPFALWTRDAIRQLIHKRFNISLSSASVGRLMQRNGFTSQKPLRRAYQRNPEAVRLWLSQEYPAIRAQARRENAVIHFGDECGFRSDHQTGTTYGKRGQTPVIPGTGRRYGANMISAISRRGEMQFMIYDENLNGEVFIRFLELLLKDAKGKILLILDRHSVHRCGAVSLFTKENSAKLEIFYLPAYCPEMNPVELLNHDVKANAVGRKRPRTKEEMISNVRSYMHNRVTQPDVVANFFQERHVRYATL